MSAASVALYRPFGGRDNVLKNIEEHLSAKKLPVPLVFGTLAAAASYFAPTRAQRKVFWFSTMCCTAYCSAIFGHYLFKARKSVKHGFAVITRVTSGRLPSQPPRWAIYFSGFPGTCKSISIPPQSMQRQKLLVQVVGRGSGTVKSASIAEFRYLHSTEFGDFGTEPCDAVIVDLDALSNAWAVRLGPMNACDLYAFSVQLELARLGGSAVIVLGREARHDWVKYLVHQADVFVDADGVITGQFIQSSDGRDFSEFLPVLLEAYRDAADYI